MIGAPAGGNLPLFAWIYCIIAVAIWRILLEHCTVAAARRALLRAGRRIPTSTAIIPMTTSNSTSVNPALNRRWLYFLLNGRPPHDVNQFARLWSHILRK